MCGSSVTGCERFRVEDATAMSLPVKRSVAVLIRNGDNFLSTRRADDDDELPGVWGLPAGSYRELETLEDLITRIGRDKLGVTLIPIRRLGRGRQERERYVLEMELWEVGMSGVPRHAEWRWVTVESLEDGKSQGSLCCRLAIEVLRA
jgi:ADP-ribose pyrophosphatase YjhB (NUDIX family)